MADSPMTPIDRFAHVTGTRKRELQVRRADFATHGGYELCLIEYDRVGQTTSAARFTWETVQTGRTLPDGLGFALTPPAAQDLFDDLWKLGLRPSDGEPSSGILAAMQSHIADLRAVARHVLKMPPGAASKGGGSP